MAYTRVHRLLRILLLIQSENGWNARRLALECGVTERTIYRDLEELEGAGVPWAYDARTDGYRVRKDFFLPPLHLTAEEAAALHAYVSFSSTDGAMRVAAVSALRKVMSQLPDPVRNGLGERDRANNGDVVDVELSVASASEIDALPWAPCVHELRVERTDADAAVVYCRTHDEEALARWALAQGGACVVRRPEALAGRVRELAQHVAKAHDAAAPNNGERTH